MKRLSKKYSFFGLLVKEDNNDEKLKNIPWLIRQKKIIQLNKF